MTPNKAVSDGSTGGNPRFYFLPPLMQQPSTTGEFNPDVSPTVDICASTAQTADGRCASLLASFNRGPQFGVNVIMDTKSYVLHWRTPLTPVSDDVPFRIIVRVGSLPLGYIDLIKRAGQFYNYTTGGFVHVDQEGTMAVKFRIEEGALCTYSVNECIERLVGPEGGTFTIDREDGTKSAGTQFPQYALNDTVTLIIEHIPAGECLPTDAPQYQGCYRFMTEPHLDNFELPVTVGVCMFDPTAWSYFTDGQLRLWKWSEVEGEPIQELERVTVDYLNCPTFASLGARSGSPLLYGAARAGSWLLKPIAALIGPRDAYAMVGYEGGKLINFSRIGWVRPLNTEIRAGDGQTAPAGSTLPIQPKVRVTNKYGSTIQAVPGRTVDFTPSAGGSANPSSAVTDALGEAATTWTLSATAGVNSLLARTPTSRPIAPTPYQAEALFSANGTAIPTGPTGVLWLPLIGEAWDGVSGVVSPSISPVVVITANGKTTATLTPTRGATAYTAARDIMDFQHSTTYRVSVQVDGQTLGYVDIARGVASKKLYNVATGKVVADITLSKSFQISFRILQ